MTSDMQALNGRWNQFRGLVKQRWSELTEDDLQLLEGSIEQMVGRIQQKTGEGREAIESFFSDLTSRGSTAVAHAATSVGQYAHQVGDRVRGRYDRMEEVVREDPAKSVVLVFGIGVVAGLIAGLAIRSR